MKKENSLKTIIIDILFVLAIVLMTVGFAAYGQMVHIGGTATIMGNGIFYISSVETISLSNAKENLTFTNNNVDFNLEFTTASGQSDYSAVFDITLTNDSVFDYTFSTPEYSHIINRQSNGNPIDISYLHYEITGINTGDIIEAKTKATFRITFTFTNPLSDEQYDTFIIDGDFKPTVTENKIARLYADVNHNEAQSLRDPNTTAAYTIKVGNTHSTPQTFRLSLNSNKFDIKDENMNTPVEYTVGANETETTFTFYLVKKSGVNHYTNTERVTVLVDTEGQNQFSAGVISVLVDQNNFYKDENAPLISNVTVTKNDSTAGSVTISWNGRDLETSSPTGYTIITYKVGDGKIGEVTTTESETTAMSKTITVPSNGTYYFTVIGTDAAGNTATSTEINEASTSEGHASKSNDKLLEWKFTISFTLPNCTSKANETVTWGSDYTTSFTPESNFEITGITIKVGDNNATMSSSGYETSNSYKNLTIHGSYITGNINVRVTTQSTGGNSGCLG